MDTRLNDGIWIQADHEYPGFSGIDLIDANLSQVRDTFEQHWADIGKGDFDADALSQISDPRERLDQLWTMLNDGP